MCVIESRNLFQSVADERRKIHSGSDPQSVFEPSSAKVFNEFRHEHGSIDLVNFVLFPRIVEHTKSTCLNSNLFPVISYNLQLNFTGPSEFFIFLVQAVKKLIDLSRFAHVFVMTQVRPIPKKICTSFSSFYELKNALTCVVDAVRRV